MRISDWSSDVCSSDLDDEEKPRFASLRATQRIDTVTLDEALALFRLPRKLGFLPDGDEIEVNIGRFGPYVRYGKKFVSLKKDDDPYTVELPRSEEHTSELQSLMRISYAVFCFKQKTTTLTQYYTHNT